VVALDTENVRASLVGAHQAHAFIADCQTEEERAFELQPFFEGQCARGVDATLGVSENGGRNCCEVAGAIQAERP
jgi:hypothetical protein